MKVCRALTQDADDESPGQNGSAEAWLILARLRFELAAYCYYCATLLQFFDLTLTDDRLKEAEKSEKEKSGKEISQLARARQSFAVSPQITWSMTSVFRDAYGMGSLSVSGEPGETVPQEVRT